MANNISRANRIKRSPGDAFVQVLLYVFVATFCHSNRYPVFICTGWFLRDRAGAD